MIATPLKKIRIKVINLPPPQTPKKKKEKENRWELLKKSHLSPLKSNIMENFEQKTTGV